MGEYEPDDSRDVTQNPGKVPGEPPRTGPREDEARRDAKSPPPGNSSEDEARDANDRHKRDQQTPPRVKRGKMMEQPQQQGVQLGGQSQSQSQGRRHAPEQPAERLDGDGARQAGESEARKGTADEQPGETETERAGDAGPAPGSREAGIAQAGKEDLIDEGDPRADLSQYEINTPQNMPHESRSDEERRRQQARAQERIDPESDERGYGGAGEKRIEEIEEDR